MDSSSALHKGVLLNPKHCPFLYPKLRPCCQSRQPILWRCSSSSSPAVIDLRIHRLAAEFRSLPEPIDRVKRLLSYADDLPPFLDADRVPCNRVTGCTAEVWLSSHIDALGRMRFAADSDSVIARGFCACLLSVVQGALPEEVLAVRRDDLAELNVVGLGARSRVNTWHNVLLSMQRRALAMVDEGEEQPRVDPFPPELPIGDEGFAPSGAQSAARSNKTLISQEITF
ncbi:hypothetical protein HPP92_023374 [Vanilla planifolia]|uniref:Fe-S metabolism associated domain-containing protein n=1 Tax=Vanilla planifolia TaxID=51239 RepID=A0A835PYD2_VANPL|nr:hypothetical protein HPP92_023374 [Vanilla planifolia]